MAAHPSFEIIGHRGARGLFPENTVEGFLKAWELGIERFETDIAITRDDVPVLSHEPRLNPDITQTSEGAWLEGPGPLIRDLRFSELARYNVGRLRPGSAYAQKFPEQRPIEPARIPRLAEALAVLPQARFTIELKIYPDHPDLTTDPEEMVERVVAVAKAAGMLTHVRLQSFDWRAPRYLRHVYPEIARAWLTAPKTAADPMLWWGIPRRGTVAEAVAAEGGDTWSPEHSSLTADEVASARNLGLSVVPWTVNAPQDVSRLIEMGAVGVISDRPDLALSVTKEAHRF